MSYFQTVTSDYFHFLFLLTVPLFMAAPTVIGVSSSQANVSWVAPAETQVRGQVISYNIYQYIQTDLSKTPFAPPYFWMVSPYFKILVYPSYSNVKTA